MDKQENIDNTMPLMSQYNGIKKNYSNEILLFRVGDFYETFNQDAIETAKILSITLTKKSNGNSSKIPLAGFPYHALDNYLPKLVAAGKRVAICEQLEEPQKGKKIVDRGVTEVITPGIILSEKLLKHNENNFLMSIHSNKEVYGFSLFDISTGDFIVSEGDFNYLQSIIYFYKPNEIIYQKNKKPTIENSSFNFFPIQDWVFDFKFCYDKLTQQFNSNTLKGFGIEELKVGIISAGVILFYLEETKNNKLHHITAIRLLEKENYLWMDKFTVNNLELIYSNNSGALTVLKVIDFTTTNMGSRLLRSWLIFPLKNITDILERQANVEFFLLDQEIRSNILNELLLIPDMERILSKIVTYKINPMQLKSFVEGLKSIQNIKRSLKETKANNAFKLEKEITDSTTLVKYIEEILDDNPPVQLNNGNVIKPGFCKELDDLRNLQKNAKDFVESYRIKEIEKTGINSLKIDYNSVFGYYIEIRNTHKDKVPQNWIRKQTLVNAERYFTAELKEFETQIFSAEEKIKELEKNIYYSLLENIVLEAKSTQLNAKKIAEIDCLLSLAVCALENNFVKPEINNTLDLIINEGRHPVIEKKLENKEAYISNNTYLSPTDQQIIMLTGPNMAGKSALLRQTAIIVILAQMGGFIPAESAKIGCVDKIFTRVGASDNISNNESTFMVEMNETASILNNLSSRSLVLLDEIGRGTSTYDGVSLAWAVAEYLHEHKTCAKTIFATHYHELNEMTFQFNRIKNYNVSVKEFDGKILFLRKLVPGGVEHSFGIHVAKMAGVPKSVIMNAEKMLEKLESKKGLNSKTTTNKADSTQKIIQTSFFNQNDTLLQELKVDLEKIDLNIITPIEALFKLNEIKNKII